MKHSVEFSDGPYTFWTIVHEERLFAWPMKKIMKDLWAVAFTVRLKRGRTLRSRLLEGSRDFIPESGRALALDFLNGERDVEAIRSPRETILEWMEGHPNTFVKDGYPLDVDWWPETFSDEALSRCSNERILHLEYLRRNVERQAA